MATFLGSEVDAERDLHRYADQAMDAASENPRLMLIRPLVIALSGEGEWRPSGVYFRGEARAAPAEREALDNLLNIIGRRQGERSVILIG